MTRFAAIACCASALASLSPAMAAAPGDGAIAPDAIERASVRAAAVVAAMTPAEKTVLTHGLTVMPIDIGNGALPEGAIVGTGFVSGIARLGVPFLRETDASLGVAYLHGVRNDHATAMPSGLAQAASWDVDLVARGGALIGQEARAKGYNVMLAGGVNLTRDPRAGRNFEYLGEDPLLAGRLAGAAIRGVQSNHIISTIKHFALNGQETGRTYADSRIDEAAAHESDLLAFSIALHEGQPLSVMCGYNRVNGFNACDNDWLLNRVLKQEWGFRGFVMSDWGAVNSVSTALNGLDQQSGAQLDPEVYLGAPLAARAATDPAYARRVDDMNRRIVTAMFAAGLDSHPAAQGGAIDFAAHHAVALEAARKGIVLLRNEGGILPLAAHVGRVAVIGGLANVGVPAGGGSSLVSDLEGPAATLPFDVEGAYGNEFADSYHRSSPLEELRKALPGKAVTYRSGQTLADAVDQARKADVAIVFATKPSGEGHDSADLTLPGGQDALIAAVAAANPHTVVVLETGNPVAMPWLGSTAAVIEAWFPGAAGGEAIADVLTGKFDPSGRLPMTFPASEAQLPRRHIDGYFESEPDFVGSPPTPTARLMVDYTIEGADVGYRWFARKGEKPLFPFGFGLSYTHFAVDPPVLSTGTDGLVEARVTVRNTGQREGAEVVQVYVVDRAGKPCRRLAGFGKVALDAGASATMTLALDPHVLADWVAGHWVLRPGDYGFALGRNAEDLDPAIKVHLKRRVF